MLGGSPRRLTLQARQASRSNPPPGPQALLSACRNHGKLLRQLEELEEAPEIDCGGVSALVDLLQEVGEFKLAPTSPGLGAAASGQGCFLFRKGHHCGG